MIRYFADCGVYLYKRINKKKMSELMLIKFVSIWPLLMNLAKRQSKHSLSLSISVSNWGRGAIFQLNDKWLTFTYHLLEHTKIKIMRVWGYIRGACLYNF